MEVFNKLKNGFMIFLIIFVIVPIIFISSVILVDSFLNPDDIPSFFGWKPFIVLSNSMSPAIGSGDMVIVREIDNNKIKAGDVIAFRKDEFIVNHRVVQVMDDEKLAFSTKGDAIDILDDFLVYEDEIEGVYQYRLRGFGDVCLFLQTPMGMIICLSVPIILLFFLQYIEQKRKEKDS